MSNVINQRGIQIKVTKRYNYIPIRMGIFFLIDNTSVDKYVEQTEILILIYINDDR